MSQLSFSSFDAIADGAWRTGPLPAGDHRPDPGGRAPDYQAQVAVRCVSSLRRRRSRSICAPSWPASRMRCSRCCSSIR